MANPVAKRSPVPSVCVYDMFTFPEKQTSVRGAANVRLEPILTDAASGIDGCFRPDFRDVVSLCHRHRQNIRFLSWDL